MIVRHDLARTRAAEFSECGRYRYRLRYSFTGSVLDAPVRPVAFVMLNPSTATELEPDPTVRRCMGFARAWGYSDLLVTNIFALRSTDPDELLKVDDPVGPENDAVLATIPRDMPVVCAWGIHRATRGRAGRVVRLLDRPLLCLGTTAYGGPRHPLYLRADLTPLPWRPEETSDG